MNIFVKLGMSLFILLISFSSASANEDCKSYLKISDKDNNKYTWTHVDNKHASKVIHATIKNSWTYNKEKRSETKAVILSPRASINVFYFDRSQKSKSEVAGCYFHSMSEIDRHSEQNYLSCIVSKDGHRDSRCCLKLSANLYGKYQLCTISSDERWLYYKHCEKTSGYRCCDHLSADDAKSNKVCGF